MHRECGNCSLCCKMFEIAELSKHDGEWCKHCDTENKRCTIYESRPEVCRTFMCSWLMNHHLKDEWYPDTSRMVITANQLGDKIIVNVDPDAPEAWKKPLYYKQLKKWSYFGRELNPPNHVIVRVNERFWQVTPEQDYEITDMVFVSKDL